MGASAIRSSSGFQMLVAFVSLSFRLGKLKISGVLFLSCLFLGEEEIPHSAPLSAGFVCVFGPVVLLLYFLLGLEASVLFYFDFDTFNVLYCVLGLIMVLFRFNFK